MAAIVVRVALLAIGLGFGEMGLDAFARGADSAVQFGVALVSLVSGTAAFIGPLFASRPEWEVGTDV